MTPSEIRSKRLSLGLSPEQFAAKLGVIGNESRVTVWRWENGKRTPSAQTIMLIKQLRTRRRKQ